MKCNSQIFSQLIITQLLRSGDSSNDNLCSGAVFLFESGKEVTYTSIRESVGLFLESGQLSHEIVHPVDVPMRPCDSFVFLYMTTNVRSHITRESLQCRTINQTYHTFFNKFPEHQPPTTD